MAPVVSVKYLYVSSCWSEDELFLVLNKFEATGYDSGHRCMARSVLEAAEQVPFGATLVLYTVEVLGSTDGLLDLLVWLQERGVLLRSLKEPWVNELIRDHAYCVAKLRQVMNTLQGRSEGGIKNNE